MACKAVLVLIDTLEGPYRTTGPSRNQYSCISAAQSWKHCLTILLVQSIKVYMAISAPGFPNIIPIGRARNQRTRKVSQRMDCQSTDEQRDVLEIPDLSKN